MRLLKRWLPSFIICFFIFTSSSMPGAQVSEIKSLDVLAHKFSHLLLYFFLCFTFFRATKSILASFLLTLLYGISDEYHQLFIATRGGTVGDIFIDSLAALFSSIVLWKYFHNLPEKLRIWLKE